MKEKYNLKREMDKYRQIAAIIVSAFQQLYVDFNQITSGAKYRFENKKWKDQREAVQHRIHVFDRLHQYAISEIQALEIYSLNPNETEAVETIILAQDAIDQTWLHAFADNVLMYFSGWHISKNVIPSKPLNTLLAGPGKLPSLLNNLLEPFALADKEKTIESINLQLQQRVDPEANAHIVSYPDLLYRNQHAYLLAIYQSSSVTLPFILPMVHQNNGIVIDAFLTEENDLMQIFSFTRSYFQVVCDNPSGLALFIKKIIPNKPLPQLIINLGYQDYGKKLLLQELHQHLERSGEQFTYAPGIKGMVMIVFTTPQSNYVIKVIRDHPKPPKESTKKEVIEKYNLVASLDRAGRVADAQRYLKVHFPERLFTSTLLHELQTEAAESCSVSNGIVELRDIYLERKMIPMNLFIASFPDLAKPIILDYGKAIIEMISSNLFPGDLLIKNFGVVAQRRVVFYDYDEVSLVTECEFLPLPANSEEEDGTERSTVVYPNQIFPEELIRFLLPRQYRSILTDEFGELFTPDYWNRMKSNLAQQIYDDKAPYKPNLL